MALDGIRYRPATARDAHVIAELVAGGFATYATFAPDRWRPRSARQEEPEIHMRLSRGDVHARIALDESGRLSGFTGWMPALSREADREPLSGRAHLWSLFVAERLWGSGLASVLLDWSVTGMRDSGYDVAQLFTPRDHARARTFYAREGWADTESVEFNPVLGLDLIRLERPLR